MDRDTSETLGPAGNGDASPEDPPAGLGLEQPRPGGDADAPGMLHRLRRRLLQGAVVLCTLFLLLWAAFFIYGSFYYSFMPKAAYSTPVHYYYRSDCGPAEYQLCSYPTANVSLLQNGRNRVMSLGQKYRISLELQVPDSPTNQKLGMFTIRMTCYSKEGGRLASSAHSVSRRPPASSSRATMLRYQSGLLRMIATLLYLPGFLSGVTQQTQSLEVELFPQHTEDPFSPTVGAMVEVLSSEVQIYSAQLHIHADFTGLRYLLVHYPVMSALVGVSSNMVFLSMLLLFSYMRLLFGGTRTTRSYGENGENGENRVTAEDTNTSEDGGTPETNHLEDSLLIRTTHLDGEESHRHDVTERSRLFVLNGPCDPNPRTIHLDGEESHRHDVTEQSRVLVPNGLRDPNHNPNPVV